MYAWFLLSYTCFQYVKNEYCEWKQDISQHIVFENDTITLDLPHSPLLIVDQWKIIPNIPQVTIQCLVSLACSIIIIVALPSQIAKVNVHQFQQGIIPSCSVTLQWTGSEGWNNLFIKWKSLEQRNLWTMSTCSIIHRVLVGIQLCISVVAVPSTNQTYLCLYFY